MSGTETKPCGCALLLKLFIKYFHRYKVNCGTKCLLKEIIVHNMTTKQYGCICLFIYLVLNGTGTENKPKVTPQVTLVNSPFNKCGEWEAARITFPILPSMKTIQCFSLWIPANKSTTHPSKRQEGKQLMWSSHIKLGLQVGDIALYVKQWCLVNMVMLRPLSTQRLWFISEETFGFHIICAQSDFERNRGFQLLPQKYLSVHKTHLSAQGGAHI